MTSKKLREKLERLSEVALLIESTAKPLYEEYGKLTAECAEAIAERKGKDFVGLIKTPLRIKLGGRVWYLKPNFVNKEGIVTNLIWKCFAAHAYSVVEERSE